MKIAEINQNGNKLRPVKVNRKWGYFREGDGLVIDAVYESVREFSDGLAAVSIETWDDDCKRPPLYKIINEAGETVIPPFRGVPTGPIGFNCGLMLVLFSDYEKSRDISFHLDIHGNRHFEGIYESIGNFYDGLACVKVGDTYGFIDQSGKMVIDPQFGEFTQFSEGFAIVSEKGNNRTGIIDTYGDYKISPSRNVNLIYGISEGVAIARSSAGFYFVDMCGNISFEGIFLPYGMCPFSEGMSRYSATPGEEEPLVGFINKDGKVFEPQYTDADDFSEGLCRVGLLNERYVYINKNFEEVIDVSDYVHTFDFVNGLAQVWTDDAKLGYINKLGEIVWEPTK